MLTGTLITAAGFLPIATAASSTGEYTRSLFQVVTIALLVSWIAAVLFIPWLGDRLLPDLTPSAAAEARQPWRTPPCVPRAPYDRWPQFAGVLAPAPLDAHHHDPYQRPFYVRFRRLLDACLRRRWWVIAATAGLFVLSLLMFRFVPQQFFPDSTRPELMVDLELAEGVSLRATEAQAKKLETLLQGRKDIRNYVAYVGTGSPRFYLPLDQQLPATNFAQFVVLAEDTRAREELRNWLLKEIAPRFPELQMRVTRLENGPPVGYPVQFRVSGEHIPQVRAIAREVAERVRANPHTTNVNLDWDEPSKVVRMEVDQDRARALGISSAQLAQFLSVQLSGYTASTYREGNELVGIMLRGGAGDRDQLELLGSRRCRPATVAGCSCRRWHACARCSRTGSSGTATGCRRSPSVPTSATNCCRRRSPRRSIRPWTRSAPGCRRATCCRSAVRSRMRRAARTRSPRACRCS